MNYFITVYKATAAAAAGAGAGAGARAAFTIQPHIIQHYQNYNVRVRTTISIISLSTIYDQMCASTLMISID